MKLVITESQYKTLVTEHYDADKLYDRERIVAKLKTSRHMREYIKKLPHIPVENEKGEVRIATRIPQTIHEYIFGNF